MLKKQIFLGFIIVSILSSLLFLSLPSVIDAARACSLSFVLEPSVTTINSGDTITYKVILKNLGKNTCFDTSFSFAYSSNEKFVSSVPKSTAGGYYWYVGNLKPNKTRVTTIVTQHDSLISDKTVDTEAWATANLALDVYATSTVLISSVFPPSTPTTPPIPTSTPTPTPPLPVEIKQSGVWIWDSPIQMTASRADSQILYASNNGFNVVYITIDDYLDIYSLPSGIDKNNKKDLYFSALLRIVKKANSLNMDVDLEGGWRDWAIPNNRWKGFALIDFVKEYNQKYPDAKVRGFQYDVEPYILPNYETDKLSVLTEYISFIDESVTRMQSVDAVFSIVIPHFYDDVANWTPLIKYNGVTTHTYNHLLSVLEKKPGSEIILMSYRNFFSGPNGIQEISKTEVSEASLGNYSTRVIIAQETGNVLPAYITYYGLTKINLFDNLSLISDDFGVYSNFGGTAVHYLDSLQDL